jgi:hypothetical protein
VKRAHSRSQLAIAPLSSTACRQCLSASGWAISQHHLAHREQCRPSDLSSRAASAQRTQRRRGRRQNREKPWDVLLVAYSCCLGPDLGGGCSSSRSPAAPSPVSTHVCASCVELTELHVFQWIIHPSAASWSGSDPDYTTATPAPVNQAHQQWLRSHQPKLASTRQAIQHARMRLRQPVQRCP